jgi:hypothetical protein
MTRVIADETLPGKLHNLAQPVEVCDTTGRLLGRFFPVLDPSQYEGLEPEISKEELERRKQSKGKTYTTAEVINYLKKL